MKFIIIRHVQTKANSENKIYGRSESEYTEKGINQIEKIKDILKDEKADKIISSPLTRTKKLGEALSDLLNLELEIEDDLIEMNFGIFDGKTHIEAQKEYKEEWNNWINDYKNYKIPDGESFDEVFIRVKNFIDKYKDNEGCTILVTHGGIVQTIIPYLLGLQTDTRWNFRVLPGAIIEIEYINNFGILNNLIQTF